MRLTFMLRPVITRPIRRLLGLVAAVAVSLAGSSSSSAAAPPRVAVLFEPTAGALPHAQIRAAISAELGAELVDGASSATEGVLIIGVADSGDIVVTLRQVDQPVVRTVPVPYDPADTAALVGLLAGNLVRNEALELLPPLRDAAPSGAASVPPGAASVPPGSGAVQDAEPAVVDHAAQVRSVDRRLFLMLGLGSGFGWTKGSPDVNPTAWNGQRNQVEAVEFAGLARTGGFHLAPEVGYLVRPTMLLGVQLRLQRVLGATEVHRPTCAPDGVCPPSRGALAVLARVGWLPALSGRTQLMITGSVGLGRVRHLAPLQDVPLVEHACGDLGDQPCVDTVASDLVLLGPGIAVLYRLGGALSLYVSLQGLVGLPRPMLNVDGAAGLALRL